MCIRLVTAMTLGASALVSVPAVAQNAAPLQPQAAPQATPQKERTPVYDESADAGEDIAAALAKAKTENRRVLIQWGANWCGWCVKLHDLCKSDRELGRKLMYEYDVVKVDVGRFDKHLDLAEKFGADLKSNGLPFLTVLDADGNAIANQETGSLEEGNAHDPAKVMAFFEAHQAAYLPAESILAEGLAKAKTEEKVVFLHFGAPWCGWCHRLEDWMALPEVAKVYGRAFVDVKIDLDRTIGGPDVLARYRKGVGGGIPWFAFVRPDGTVIATSDVNGENLGCPWSPAEKAAFAKLLGEVTEELTEREVEGMLSKLGE